MTTKKFEEIQWKSGMKIAIGNIHTDVVSVDFQDKTIAFEDEKGLVWVNSEYVILKQRRHE